MDDAPGTMDLEIKLDHKHLRQPKQTDDAT